MWCRTTKLPRDIPLLPWYRTTVPQMVMAGFLPFSAIYIELYYIFASICGHKVCAAHNSFAIILMVYLCVRTVNMVHGRIGSSLLLCYMHAQFAQHVHTCIAIIVLVQLSSLCTQPACVM